MLKFFPNKENNTPKTEGNDELAKKLAAQKPQFLRKTSSRDLNTTLDTVNEGHNENAPPSP